MANSRCRNSGLDHSARASFVLRIFDQKCRRNAAKANSATPPTTPPATAPAVGFDGEDEVLLCVGVGMMELTEVTEVEELADTDEEDAELEVELGGLPIVAGPSLKTFAGVLQQRVPSA